MKKDNKKDNEEVVDGTIDPYSEDNDNIGTMTILQLNLLQDVCKNFDDGTTIVGPEVVRILKQFCDCLIIECSKRAVKLAKLEGDEVVQCEHILKSMDQINSELPL